MPTSSVKKTRRQLPKTPTGIQGLDEITGDGFPQRPAHAGPRQRGRMDASVEQVVQRADKALYQAKGEGGNCTVIFDSGTENETSTRKPLDSGQT